MICRQKCIPRSFSHSLILPEDVDVPQIKSLLSDDGKLCIEAPKAGASKDAKQVDYSCQFQFNNNNNNNNIIFEFLGNSSVSKIRKHFTSMSRVKLLSLDVMLMHL